MLKMTFVHLVNDILRPWHYTIIEATVFPGTLKAEEMDLYLCLDLCLITISIN